jgi:hypothetical protein
MAKERPETEGHDHEVTTQKVSGKQQVVLKRGCARCEEIKKAREEAKKPPKDRLETQGHGHKVQIDKMLTGGKPRIILVNGCKRCEEIKKEREEKDKARERAIAAFFDRHPDNDVNAVLQVWRNAKPKNGKEWKIEKSQNGTFIDITCPQGRNVRISARKLNKNQKEKFKEWYDKHAEDHPGE